MCNKQKGKWEPKEIVGVGMALALHDADQHLILSSKPGRKDL